MLALEKLNTSGMDFVPLRPRRTPFRPFKDGLNRWSAEEVAASHYTCAKGGVVNNNIAVVDFDANPPSGPFPTLAAHTRRGVHLYYNKELWPEQAHRCRRFSDGDLKAHPNSFVVVPPYEGKSWINNLPIKPISWEGMKRMLKIEDNETPPRYFLSPQNNWDGRESTRRCCAPSFIPLTLHIMRQANLLVWLVHIPDFSNGFPWMSKGSCPVPGCYERFPRKKPAFPSDRFRVIFRSYPVNQPNPPAIRAFPMCRQCGMGTVEIVELMNSKGITMFKNYQCPFNQWPLKEVSASDLNQQGG